MQATRRAVEGRAVLRGAAVGLAVIVPVTIVRAVVERQVTDLSTSIWIYPLSVLVLVAYAAAGVVAARAAHQAPVVHGALAGLGTVLAWIPVRVVIWAVREGGRDLFTGDRAALGVTDLVGALAVGLTVGMLGAVVASRVPRRDRAAAAPPGSG